MKPLSIYVHVPFCASKCAYCDFASWPGREGDRDRYFRTLWAEIEARADALTEYEVTTVFFGGGTPTLVPEAWIVETLNRLRARLPFSPRAEVTVEGNPGTLKPGQLDALRKAGVDRLSLGAQSFDDALLRSLGRVHTAAQIEQAVELARKAGFSNINLDLMYALPGQTMRQWMHTLEQAVALGVEHLSAYSLIVEEGTPMSRRVSRGEAVLPDEDEVNAMQRQAVERLARAGYGRYEISNFAKPGRECRHNIVYWRRGEYLGLGCAAHSFLGGCRFHDPLTLDAYLSWPQRQEVQRLTRQDEMEETLMLSTRMTEGLDMAAWERDFGEPFEKGRRAALDLLERSALIDRLDGKLRLTSKGMELHNAVVLALLTDT